MLSALSRQGDVRFMLYEDSILWTGWFEPPTEKFS